jgi:hypothetical protein
MTPEDIAERLREWASKGGTWTESTGFTYSRRRVKLVEYEGARRLWALWRDGTQVGHVRLRMFTRLVYGQDEPAEWTVETSSGVAREALGLDTAAQSGQTDPG